MQRQEIINQLEELYLLWEKNAVPNSSDDKAIDLLDLLRIFDAIENLQDDLYLLDYFKINELPQCDKLIFPEF